MATDRLDSVRDKGTEEGHAQRSAKLMQAIREGQTTRALEFIGGSLDDGFLNGTFKLDTQQLTLLQLVLSLAPQPQLSH